MGRRPKITFGSHFIPMSGAAEISAPHHVDSAGRRFPRFPNVKSTLVAPWEYTVVSLGDTLIDCATAEVVNAPKSARPIRYLRIMLSPQKKVKFNPALKILTRVSAEVASMESCERAYRSA